MKKSGVISYPNRLLFCFLLGIIGGTIVANLLSSELQSQIGYFDALFWSEKAFDATEKRQLWGFVLRQRLFEMLGVWLVTLTVFSEPGFCILTTLVGGSHAIILSIITTQKGLIGLVIYLASIFPQALLYIPVYLVLASWAGEDTHTIRLRGLLVLLVLLVVGASAEVYLNPYMMEIFRKL